MKSSFVLLSASVAIILALLSFSSAPSNYVLAAESPSLTSTLIAWISSQCEGIIEEIEAIAKSNSESNNFSLVNYLRYLVLYESLAVVSSKPIDELKWVRRKANAFEKVNKAVEEIVLAYLNDLDAALTKLELAEPKGKQNKVGDKWLGLYKTIRYIATHVSRYHLPYS